MGIQEKTKPVPPRPAVKGRGADGNTQASGSSALLGKRVDPNLVAAASDTARDVARSALLEKNPYLKAAFANPYNLSLFLGALAAAGLTLNPLLALVAIGMEGLWLLHAPESKRLRHLLWDPRFAKLKEAVESAERAERLKGLGDEARERVEALVARQKDIRQLAAQNPSFTGDLLRNELVKTDRLVSAFVEMSVTTARYQAYLDSIDFDEIERDRRRYEGIVRNGSKEEPQTEVAKKNFAILLKRLEKMKEIRRYLTLAQGQLDLIENSFRLIQDQIVTMQSPQELSGQLDELVDGVEAIKETSRDTEAMLASMSLDGALTERP